MNISKSKIAFYYLTFQKSKIPVYLLDLGNSWVNNELSDGTKEKIQACLANGRFVLGALNRYSWLCPEKWRKSYDATVAAFASVVDACEDLKLQIDEIKNIATTFKIAYSEWCAD